MYGNAYDDTNAEGFILYYNINYRIFNYLYNYII